MEPESLHLKRACEGDPAAFTALVRLYDTQLRAYAYRLLRDGVLMDDALQNAYLAAFRSIGRFRGDASFKNWMYRIVHNACIDLIRKQCNDVQLSEETAVFDDSVASRDTRLDLGAAFDRMTVQHRAVLVLIDVEGLDYGEAAQILSIPVGTVRSRLSRARSAMRDVLGGDQR